MAKRSLYGDMCDKCFISEKQSDRKSILSGRRILRSPRLSEQPWRCQASRSGPTSSSDI